MRRGRPPRGAGHVDRLEGDRQGKRRLRVILEVTEGTRTVKEACRELGLSEARFHEMRREALGGALRALAPSPRGRPRRAGRTASASRVEELERELRETKLELHTALVRTEVALAMPHLLKGRKRAGADSKKNANGRGTSRGSKR